MLVNDALGWFVARFERFLVQHSPLWYSWGDKRRTRVPRGDSQPVGIPATTACGRATVATDHMPGT